MQAQAEPKRPDSSAPDSDTMARAAAQIAFERKGENLKVLDLSQVSDFTDRFLIVSGTNDRQVQAISDGIVRALRKLGVRPLDIEGYKHARWVLLDYGGDLVIHIFLDEYRRLYDLERLWSDAPDLTPGMVAAVEGAAVEGAATSGESSHGESPSDASEGA